MSSIFGFFHRAGAFLMGILGGWDNTLRILLLMMALDYLSGLAVAVLGKSPKTQGGHLDSRAGLRGLLRKGLILMVLAVAAQIDLTLESAVARATAAWFYIVNEGISVLENAALAGVPLPARLLSLLETKQADARTKTS